MILLSRDTRYAMLSVRLSVHLSVTLRYRGHMGSVILEVVTRLISLGSISSL